MDRLRRGAWVTCLVRYNQRVLYLVNITLFGIMDIQCVKERRDSLCPKYFQKINESKHRLITYLGILVRYAISMMYEDYTNTR